MNSPQWIVGMCSVLFDIDVGPKVQEIVGACGLEGDVLTPEERQDIAFYAFPVRMRAKIAPYHANGPCIGGRYVDMSCPTFSYIYIYGNP